LTIEVIGTELHAVRAPSAMAAAANLNEAGKGMILILS
jgi:hypothetical protein